jgi:hypothetical protein
MQVHDISDCPWLKYKTFSLSKIISISCTSNFLAHKLGFAIDPQEIYAEKKKAKIEKIKFPKNK